MLSEPHAAAEQGRGSNSCSAPARVASASATGWSLRTSAPAWQATAARTRRTCRTVKCAEGQISLLLTEQSQHHPHQK